MSTFPSPAFSHIDFSTYVFTVSTNIASSSFMTDAKFPEGRKLLALYPVLLFYMSLAWMVLIGFQQGPTGNRSPLQQGGGATEAGTGTNATRIFAL